MICDALDDLWLAMQGLHAVIGRGEQSRYFHTMVASFARACSVFLRKLVLGNGGRRSTRLLDDDVCKDTGLSFDSLWKIGPQRRLLEMPFAFGAGYFRIAAIDDNTRLPQAHWELPFDPQTTSISIHWPLPGTMNWVNVPTQDKPWWLRAEELFNPTPDKKLNCDQWLGQQLVMIGEKGITLKQTLRAAANSEGAHSFNTPDITPYNGGGEPKEKNHPEVNLLSNITICGVQYNHIILIETALYLYRLLLQDRTFNPSEANIDLPAFSLLTHIPGDIFADPTRWLSFVGRHRLTLGAARKPVSYELRAPKWRSG